ncbi:hypothetical protein [Calothrix sp. PCC 6303]|uniref:hypothetical protein n=1 Tax=Calothrix sp. PCC 6303 TaxID=1170562 RepID=UPI0002A02D5D|nr:hypothetical protein [Calothrix sp. PCC 6303]AFY99941.1 hypothetical protein Cal6303_0877 [Calothrix sp. PCC 6303]
MKKLITTAILSTTLIVGIVGCGSPKTTNTTSNGNTNTKLITNNNSKQSKVIVAAGTTFNTDLQQEISTAKNRNNDTFVLKIKNGNPILKGGKIEGHVEGVTKAAKGKKAKLNLVFDSIILKNGDKLPIDASLVNTQIETKTKGKFLQNAGIILGGATAGHFAGNKTNFKHGALAGGAAATAYVLSSPGGEVVMKKGTDVKLKLKTPLNDV